MKEILSTWFIIFITVQSLKAQEWVKIYGNNVTCWARDMKEDYDRGYILLGQVNPGATVPKMHAWFMKTDINGNLIWDKKLFSSQYQISYNGFDLTNDGGFVSAGFTTKLDPVEYDVSFIKFNACGQKEWCKIFSTPGNSDYGLKIKQIPDGYIALVTYFQEWTQKRIWLFKLDESGEPVWQKLYAQADSNINNEECYELLLTQDGGFLITGDAYYETSTGKISHLHPLIIKADSNGEEQWVLPYGAPSGYRGDAASASYENQYGFFYTTARHFRDSIPLGDSPGFLKISPDGHAVYYRDFFHNTVLGIDNTMNFINESEMIISSSWSYNSTSGDTTGVLKVDTLGNVIKKKALLLDVINTLAASTLTYDNKYLVTGGFSVNGADPHIYLFKLNWDLEYDSVYTRPFTYDSLCPYPIVSDTTNLDDCGIITAIHDPEIEPGFYEIKVYPNPSSDKITVDIPEMILKKSSNGTFNVSTIFHQWKSTTLEIYDLFGKLKLSREVPSQTRSVNIDISQWNAGMYVARLVFMNDIVASAKFVVVK